MASLLQHFPIMAMNSLAFLGFVLFVADLFHPVNGPAIELLLDGDMRHGCAGCSAVPMLFAGRKPDHIAGPDFFNRPAPALRASTPGGDNQRLPQRMRVPRRSSARLKRDDGAGDTRGIGCLEW